MSRVQVLRSLVDQRLTAAVEEVFALFERTIAEYEEQLRRSKEENHRQQKLLDAVLNPEVQLHRTDVQQVMVREDEVLLQQQERSFSLNLEKPPEPAHIKEEPEDLWSREHLQGAEEAKIDMFTFPPVPVDSEEEDGKKPLTLQLHEDQSQETRDTEHLKKEANGEDCGGSEADRDNNPYSHLQAVTHDKTLLFSGCDTDDSGDWEESDGPQEGLNPQQIKYVAVGDMTYSPGNTSVNSSECAPNFGQEKQKKTPRLTYTRKKLFSCSVCRKSFPWRKALVMHMRIHTGEKPFSCSICHKSFSQQGNLKQHFTVHTGEKPFSCSVCGKRFTRSGGVKRHSIVHTGVKPFSCSACGKRFLSKNNLDEHVQRHSLDKPFSCSICKKGFIKKAEVVTHMRIHTGEKPFSCSVCGVRFSQPGSLKQHLTVHTGEKPYNCSICGKRFTRSGGVKRHAYLHAEEKPLSCCVCDKRFTRLEHFKNHQCVGESSGNPN
ncbi:gastrula zinc finger protein XlCGF57.1-like [Cheilinus undulatus]|uniref:gastrula zinc finger protein XlCGF57.1-like n=1 Tax=Cheilinus undulatus TaxID=241271 RepID=UPI001BD39470|nr:gastrula zinc finger protein XlCGF57.1-like [Cheilinus undulatus]